MREGLYGYKTNSRTNTAIKILYIMCLYPKFILNKKYAPNKKNGNNPPIMKDIRTKYVPIGCGNCIECRKQKAREWQVRLTEEIKVNKYNYFVTLTFSEANIDKLMKVTKTSECNAVAALAVRRFLERWRKIYKKSVRHWLITELGHDNTERIHLHGILFSDTEITNETLSNIWAYGITDNGKYVNNKTINYIIKYVTKIDLDHKGYKPQIFCSAGLGKSYITQQIKERKKYTPNETEEYYTLANGVKTNLPIYYRNKLFNEQEREQLWLEKLDKEEIWVRGIKCKIDTEERYNNYLKLLKEQQADNIKLGFGSDAIEWKEKVYNASLRKLNAKLRLQNKRKIE